MAASFLNLMLKALAYNDQPSTSNPMRRHFDWGRSISNMVVSNPKGTPYTIQPNATLAIFNGTRSTSIDGTTQFTLSINSTLSRYRFTATSGTAPVLRTDRALTPNTHTLTWTANANGTSTLVSSNASEFLNVQVGDTIWVPGLTTGDTAGPFNALNEGMWVVLTTSGSTLQLQRPVGSAYSGASETIVATANSQLQAFSASGVQIGDTVDISAGFAQSVIQSYSVVMVTPTWFEVVTTATLPVTQVAAPGASGMVFYNSAKKLVIVEVQQEAAVQVNGDTTQNSRVSPMAPGDPENTGFYWKWGTTWSLSIVNRSSVPCEVNILAVE